MTIPDPSRVSGGAGSPRRRLRLLAGLGHHAHRQPSRLPTRLDSEGPSAALAPAAPGAECLRHASSALMQRELVQLPNTVAHRRDTSASRDLYDVLRQVA
jgi:hypothetical protein